MFLSNVIPDCSYSEDGWKGAVLSYQSILPLIFNPIPIIKSTEEWVGKL